MYSSSLSTFVISHFFDLTLNAAKRAVLHSGAADCREEISLDAVVLLLLEREVNMQKQWPRKNPYGCSL